GRGRGWGPVSGLVAGGGLAGRPFPVQGREGAQARGRGAAPRHYPVQDEVDTVRVAFRAPPVPGLGCAALTVAGPVRMSDADRVDARGRTLTNRLVEVTFEATGALALHDRRSGERFFDVLRLEDGGDAGDT